ncbi:MAG: DUF72 domain-containing protein [Byssovorax sp.]
MGHNGGRPAMKPVMKQIGLFLDAPAPLPLPHLEADRRLAARLGPRILVGPSTWTFPGWAGLVYPPGTAREELVDHGLSQASRYPLFRTVGIDRSHYAPLTEEELRGYARQLPPGYPCVIKAWNALTTPTLQGGAPSPAFLDPHLCEQRVLLPVARAFADHVGAIVFQFPPLSPHDLPHPDAFADRLDAFLGALPTAFPYAVEIRNRELLRTGYLEVLARHRVAHVINLWERMPEVSRQLAIPGILTAPHVVCRLSIPPGSRYEDQKRKFAPFDKIVAPNEAVRAAIVELARACSGMRTLLITVNNKVEGSSPLTIRALIERIVEDGAA